MKIVIGNGTIARALYADIRLYRPYFDVMTGRVRDVMPSLDQDDTVYLAFGASNPNRCYAYPIETREVNVLATLRLANEIMEAGAKPVFFSSELVFDGEESDYSEFSQTNPKTEYGKQKVEVEEKLKGTTAIIVRLGSVVSERAGENCVVEKTYKSLFGKAAKMAVDNEMTVTPLEPAALCIEHLKSGVYHLSGKAMSRVQLAEEIAKVSENVLAFSSVAHSEIAYPERRPKRTFLQSTRIPHIEGVESAIEKKVRLLDGLA